MSKKPSYIIWRCCSDLICIPHGDSGVPGCDMQNLFYQWDLPFLLFKMMSLILIYKVANLYTSNEFVGLNRQLWVLWFFFCFCFFPSLCGTLQFFLETFINSLYELSPSILGCRGRGVAQWFFFPRLLRNVLVHCYDQWAKLFKMGKIKNSVA